MINDLISDMLTRIRNANIKKQKFTIIPYSKTNLEIIKLLICYNYLETYKIQTFANNSIKLFVFLKYKGWWLKKPFFTTFQRISKPGQRIFSSYKLFKKNLHILQYKQGIALISTSYGIMSHLKAIKLKKGGEILCYIE